jgi:hypothetical protein
VFLVAMMFGKKRSALASETVLLDGFAENTAVSFLGGNAYSF